MSRLPYIDMAKGLGILTVLWGHSGIELLHYVIYMFHMPLFIFCSGFCHKDRPIKEAVVKKVRSLLPVYLIFLTICLLGDVVITRPTSVADTLALVGKRSGGPLWFIPCLFLSYIFFLIIQHILYKTCPKRSGLREFGIGVACLLLSAIGFCCSMYGVKLWFWIDSALSMMVFYYAGRAVKPLIVRIKWGG